MMQMLLIGGLFFGLLAYATYQPVPDYVLDKALLTVAHVLFSIINGVGKVSESFNSAPSEVIRRVVLDAISPPARNTSLVEFTYQQFADSRTLVVRPASPEARSGAGLVYFHGGGWVIGSPEMHVTVYEEFAQKAGVTVFAVRYRLAPENKFPAAFADCLAAVEAIFAGAPASGVDPSRIAIAGDSAGGQLAASVVQQLHRAGSRFRPKLQVLVYPVTQVANMQTESYLTRVKEPILKPGHMHSYISLYLTGSKAAAELIGRNGHASNAVKAVYLQSTGKSLSSQASSDTLTSDLASLATDFRVSPLLGTGLEKLALPRAHVLASEFDPLRDDAVLYAERLKRSGVKTELKQFHTYHGAMSIPNDGQKIRDYMVEVFLDEL